MFNILAFVLGLLVIEFLCRLDGFKLLENIILKKPKASKVNIDYHHDMSFNMKLEPLIPFRKIDREEYRNLGEFEMQYPRCR